VSQKSEVPDADESARKHVQEKAAQELINGQRHQTLLVLVSGIAPAERDGAIRERNQAMVRDRHSMGVLAEIAKRMLRAAEWPLRVNHPLGPEQQTKPGCERLGVLKRRECAVKRESALRMKLFEAIGELATEDLTENLDREKEAPLRINPPGVIRSQATSRNDTMNVRMMQSTLTIP
jgi:hypothetical protein